MHLGTRRRNVHMGLGISLKLQITDEISRKSNPNLVKYITSI
jgi:hypothetical protein